VRKAAAFICASYLKRNAAALHRLDNFRGGFGSGLKKTTCEEGYHLLQNKIMVQKKFC
jgi:hypothetical protein